MTRCSSCVWAFSVKQNQELTEECLFCEKAVCISSVQSGGGRGGD